jgi:hypothetical protein
VDDYVDSIYDVTCPAFIVVHAVPVYHGHVKKKKISLSCGILLVRKMNIC